MRWKSIAYPTAIGAPKAIPRRWEGRSETFATEGYVRPFPRRNTGLNGKRTSPTPLISSVPANGTGSACSR